MDYKRELLNEILELLFMTKSSLGLSLAQQNRLALLYKEALTDTGRSYVDKWAKDNNCINFKKMLD